MAEDTTTLAGQPPPPVRDWPDVGLQGTEFDPVLAELMREGPLTRIRLPHGDEDWAWLATRYDDVKMITNDPRFSRKEASVRQFTRLAPHFAPRPGALAWADQPDHNRLRRAASTAYTVGAVKRLRPRAQEMLDELVDAMVQDGPPADLIERVLEPFPISVVCEVMGVPADERQKVHTWTREIISTAGGAEASERAKKGLFGWIAQAIRDRQDGDGDDVLSLLGGAVRSGELKEEEAVSVAGPLQIGGEALTNNSGQMFYLLLTRPDLMDRVRSDPASRPAAIDELLRYIPHRTAVGLPRVALEDVVIQGVRIRAGDPVYVSYLAANRDPDVFPDPDRIDVDRDAGAHMAFGNGPHYCTGAVLCRMQIELLIDTLLERCPDLRLAVPADEVPFRQRTMIRGPISLPIAW
ncbi:biflaviolin synthase CYP158A1 [Streptomyces albiflavescens]|uniref:Biflaviolin synthase CYP158A1 n=1 Tax=Streptomyces albiflavescens TaxID=1623582 RepID=A0A917YAW6_9ACTN|nr:cytochrome P450 [Streptomyces albiflavescens]GGN83728.1 biflaviolin synthase CYP158A1 [Streptomyces albiflavescens]